MPQSLTQKSTKMKKLIPIFIVFSIVVAGFYFSLQPKPDPNSYVDCNHRLTLPFDTVKVLAMMKIIPEVNEVLKYLNDPDKSAYPKIDTIDLRDMRWACDCPNWRYADSTNEKFPTNKDFYIEQADEKLTLPDYLLPGQRIQFIGREYGGIGYPKNPEFEDPNPPRGRVFKYYAYKIYKPFKVYGPEIETKRRGELELTQFTVK